MSKKKTLHDYFGKRTFHCLEASTSISTPTIDNSIPVVDNYPPNIDNPIPEHHSIETEEPVVELRPVKAQRINVQEIDLSRLERYPGLRSQIWSYPSNQQDEIRRAYIKAGPNQFHMEKYPSDKNNRRFQASWFKQFPEWLEYSEKRDCAFCLPCYLFTKPTARPGSEAFTIEGFNTWKKVNDGNHCAFLGHIGNHPNSAHRIALEKYRDLANQEQHIEELLDRQSSQVIRNNRLLLKTTIDAVKWLTFQACAFRGHDETEESKNRGNFIEMVKLLASYNEDVNAVVLTNASQNANYTSHHIQKEILHIFARRIRSFIRAEIDNAKFCIIVDEARDESKREQMAIVLRFVDKDGFVKERFFDLVHVSDTTALNLKKEISNVLSRYNLNSQDIRGQGYDGASNMRGEWSGLQALFLSECPYSYYVHCFAHRLQLALVVASREVVSVHQFFSKLTIIVNLVTSSCKRHDQLQAAQIVELERLIDIDELETGRGLNQANTLKRAGDTRWGSHFSSLRSLLTLFNATCTVLKTIIAEGATYAQRGDADSAYDAMTSFEFVFILHLMQDIMGVTNDLCNALQRKSQDILNAMHLVSTTKALIQKMREDGWDPLVEKVKSFCAKHDLNVPDMSVQYTSGRGRSRYRKDPITFEHHFRFDVFTATIDTQLHELNSRFKEDMMELLILSSALDPRDGFKLFKIDDICKLASKFYPMDFTDQERLHLRYQLEHFELDIRQHSELSKLSTISELCQWLTKSRKLAIYTLIDRLICLVLTLLVSTATTKRAFSAMKLVKTRLRNKMEDEFLTNSLLIYIEKDIAETFDTDSIIDEFAEMKERRLRFKMPKAVDRRINK